jgi:uncharacterized protein
MDIRFLAAFTTGRTITVGWGFGVPLIAGLLLTSTIATGAGFDCKFAKSKVEKLICADTGLSRLDEQMNVLFDRIRTETAGHDGETGEVVDPVGKEQTLWRETVRDKCKDVVCLKIVYTAHLSEMRKKWSEALEPIDQ